MKTVNRIIPFLLVSMLVLLLTVRFAHADENPCTEGWLATIDRMNARMVWMREKGNDISAPDKKELEVLTDYLRKHAM